MPRTLVPFRAPRRAGRAGGQGLGAVNAATSLASDPYRMHHPNALENGIGNAAAALFRAPIERAQIEDARAARAAEMEHQHKREDDADRREAATVDYRNRDLAQRAKHDDEINAREKTRDANLGSYRDKKLAQREAEQKAKANAGTGGVRMGNLPAMDHVTTFDADGKPVITAIPWTPAKLDAQIKSRQYFDQAVANSKTMPNAGFLQSAAPTMSSLYGAPGARPGLGAPAGQPPAATVPDANAFAGLPAGMPASLPPSARPPLGAAPAPRPALGAPTPVPAAAPAPGARPALGAQPDPHGVTQNAPPELMAKTPPDIVQSAPAVSQIVAKLHPADQKAYATIVQQFAAAPPNTPEYQTSLAKLREAHRVLIASAQPQTAPQISAANNVTAGPGAVNPNDPRAASPPDMFAGE